MSELSPDEVAAVRRKLLEVEFRAKSDESFLRQLQDDPLGVLAAQGFDDPVAGEIAGQMTGEFMAGPCGECDPFSCLVTGCCVFTGGGPKILAE